MSAIEQSTEPPELNKCPNTADKFRAYRLGVESRERKLKETEMLICQLNNEINFSKNGEKNLRSQLSLAQDRLICQEKMLQKFLNISNQQRRNERISTQIEKRLEELMEVCKNFLTGIFECSGWLYSKQRLVSRIKKTREESQNVFKYASREVNLLQRIKELESDLHEKDSECDLKRMEILTLTKEMKTKETEFQQKLNNLEKELGNSVKKEAETMAAYRETLLFYKQKIEDYDRKIELYENERKSFLEDFEPSKESKVISENFTMADSTVNVNAEERSPSSNTRKTHVETNKSDIQLFQCSSSPVHRSNCMKRKMQNLHKTSMRQKPQLEFLTASQDSSSADCSAKYGRKRRLFSTNCNHYV